MISIKANKTGDLEVYKLGLRMKVASQAAKAVALSRNQEEAEALQACAQAVQHQIDMAESYNEAARAANCALEDLCEL